ncbi:hypothetical protein TNIN_102871 [Trichonephila inaurata madagascariensis]|uniref:EGF-like domain-containing protein n=1 Tax=Trichonephila inaurata madagascariensis TaxID=2747483 RepID=A0A8X6XW02_9ARAC|nr:hypothetical protein TNIN_102871 [Trichonephila inaurata madagascariensis]
MLKILFILSFVHFVHCVEDPNLCNRTEISIMKNVKGEAIEIRRMITECCPGFGMSESSCKPVCANGCFRGRCIKPDKCGCYPGWKGNSCEEACSPGYYGPNCINKCLCKNNASCSPTTGDCTCTKDWKGKLCDIPSSNNSYIYNCSINIECQNEENALV